MTKTLVKFTLVILVNLFAFLSVWHILDVIFLKERLFKLIFVFISVIPLIYFAHRFIKEQIKNNLKENGSNWK